MQHNCKAHNILLPSVAAADPLGADAYPPRPAGAGDARNQAYVVRCESADGSMVTFADVCSPADVWGSSVGVSGMAAVSSSSVQVDSSGAPVCSCGQPCDLIVRSSHEQFGEPVWVCSKQNSAECVSGVSAGDSPLMTACVAKYAGALPASFRAADVPSCSATTTRSNQNKPAGCVPAASAAAAAPVQPAIKSVGARVSKGPVSFAPEVVADVPPVPDRVQQPSSGAAGLDSAPATGSPGWLLASLGDVSGLFNEPARRQFGIGSVSPSSANALATLLIASSAGQANAH
jgi:hypothetical protein